MSGVENNLERIKSNKGVKCVVTFSSNGEPLQVLMGDETHMEESDAIQFARVGFQMMASTRAIIGQFDAAEELKILRVRLKENEIMIVPEEKYYLMVIQDPKKT